MSEKQWWRVHFRKKTVLVHGLAELERIKARKVPKIVLIEPAKVHQCSICGKEEAWTDSWTWFGSYAEMDDGKPVLKFCSEPCRAKGPKEKPPKKGQGWSTAKRQSHHRPRDDRKGDDYGRLYQARLDANHRRFPMPEHPKIADLKKGEGQCRWCGGRITGKHAHQRTAHRIERGEPDCRGEWMRHTDLDAQKAFLIERDGPGCQLCPPGSMKWRPAGEMPAWMSDWKGEERLIPVGTYIVWGESLEVDHVIELADVAHLPDEERRAYFGPDNLWLLCPTHHKAKSKLAAAERAARR